MLFRRINIIYILLTAVVGTTIISSCDTAHNVEAPDNNYFLKYFGEDGKQTAVDMVVNPDGTFVLLGQSTAGSQSIFLVKTDSEGKLLWQRKLGTVTDEPKDIEPTSDGYIILSDYQNSIDNSDIKLIRINKDGVKIDSVTRGTSLDDQANSITVLNDGGFIVTGSTLYNPDSDPNLVSSVLHYRFDANFVPFGNDKWTDFFGQGKNNVGIKTIQKDTSFYLFGYTDFKYGNQNPNEKIVLVYYRLTEKGLNGNPVYLGDINENTKTAYVTEVPDALLNGYLMVSTSDGGDGSSKLRVSKIKNPLKFDIVDDRQFDLNVFGTRRLAGVYACPSLTAPIGYLTLSNETKATGDTDIVLSKIDQSGSELWSINFGSEKNDEAAAVAELADGKIIVLCTIESASQKKMALLKLNSKGQLLN